jgi:hypothetical protein
MTTSKDRLKAICNFNEETKSMGPAASIMYMDMVSESEEMRQERKRVKRSIAIDEVLGEASEASSEYDLESLAIGLDSDIPTISPKIMSLNVSKQDIDDDMAYHQVIGFLDSNSRASHNFPGCSDYAIQHIATMTEEENHYANSRRIKSKVLMSANYIAAEGRIGPATAIIVGSDCWKWFGYSPLESASSNADFAGMQVIFEPGIEPDKVIVARGGRIENPGIACIKCVPDGSYYIKETPGWERQYTWFRIK